MNNFDFFKPRNLKEAWELKSKLHSARYIAGGTDLMVQIKNGEIKPSALISLRSIPELSGINVGEITRIKAMTTITDMVNHSELGHIFPVLIQAAKRMGSTQIRNVGTLGGNLCNCSPCADTALPLLVLDARAVLKNSKASREIPLHELFVSPGGSCLAANEILYEILLDKPSPSARAVFLKKGRVRMDLAIASIAVLLEMNGKLCEKVRIAAGSVAPVPLRLNKVEEIFENTVISDEKITEGQKMAMNCVSPITDIRSTEDYRRSIIGVYLQQAMAELLKQDQI